MHVTSQVKKMMLTFHLWNERLVPSLEEVPASEEVFASITELCSGDFFIFPLLWHNRTAVTFSVLCSCWDCYAFRLTVPKTSTDQCWLRKSSPTEEALLRLGNGLGRHFLGRDWPYKPSELRAWEKILVGIAGLKNPIGDLQESIDYNHKTNIL